MGNFDSVRRSMRVKFCTVSLLIALELLEPNLPEIRFLSKLYTNYLPKTFFIDLSFLDLLKSVYNFLRHSLINTILKEN